MKPLLTVTLALAFLSPVSITLAQSGSGTAKKHALVVSTTVGFRHSSIPTAEKIIGELAERTGEFTVDYARVDPRDEAFRGPNGRPDQEKVNEAIRAVLAEKMSPAALQKYDAVIFANTTGDLPVPDMDAFLNWIKSGKAFIGMHSASDTFPGFPAFTEMVGGHFRNHKEQVEVNISIEDPQCPSCRHLGDNWTVFDEIYLFKDYDQSKVHNLLSLDKHPNDKTPGHYPVAWRKDYGNGRVFYTSLGHREDVWDAEWKDSNGQRKNSPEVSRQYQQHILGGIRWALRLDESRPE